MEPSHVSINVYSSLLNGKEFRQRVDLPESYQHTIQAFGGFWSASFTFRTGRDRAEDWLDRGPGRHVETVGDALEVAWEGFVNEVVVNYGPLSVTRGPLVDVCNRAQLIYNGIDTSVSPPVVGTRMYTGEYNDEDSQGLWGVLPQYVTAGNMTPTGADYVVQTYLDAHAQPKTSKSFQSDSPGEVSMSVNCLGYFHWLNWGYQNLSTGMDDADDKLLLVLADSPNAAWLNFDVVGVGSNTMQVRLFEDGFSLASDIIKEIVASGDELGNRWLFGVYEGLSARYEQAPAAVEYLQSTSDPKLRTVKAPGTELRPWSVRPGKWLLFTDFLVAQSTPTALHDDPRAMFLESVQYSAPSSLSLQGGDADQLNQVMARYGLGGVAS